jgi:hypothetical protein
MLEDDLGVLMFMEMVSITFSYESSSFSLFPPTIKENKTLRGFKPSRISLFSTDIIFSGLKGSF